MNLKKLKEILSETSKAKHIKEEELIEIIKTALEKGFRRQLGSEIKIILDPKTFNTEIYKVKEVINSKEELLKKLNKEKTTEEEIKTIDDKIFNEKYIFLEEAQKTIPKIKAGDIWKQKVEIDINDMSRLSASTSKQVIMQSLREIERESLKKHLESQKGNILSGMITSVTNENVYILFNDIESRMNKLEWASHESYQVNTPLKVYLKDVKDYGKGPIILVSRQDKNLISALFNEVCPEISQNKIQINAVARIAGTRTKIAVSSNDENINPIGTLLGENNSRINYVLEEINQYSKDKKEEIDVIEYSNDINEFIKKAFAPAKIAALIPNEDEKEVMAIVYDEDLKLAIGTSGQNVKLVSYLTGWKIDIKSISESKEIGIDYNDFKIS